MKSIVVLLTAALLAACSGNGESASATGIEPQDPTLVAVGENLYAESCASCHGSDLTGTDLGPSHLSEVYEPNHHADFAFVQAVRFGAPAHHWGFGEMPPVDGLTDEDIEAIIAYVRENQRTRGFEPYPPS